MLDPAIIGLAIQNRFSTTKKKLFLEKVNKAVSHALFGLSAVDLTSIDDINSYFHSLNSGLPTLDQSDIDFALRTIEMSDKEHVHILTIADPCYPTHLRSIKNPPSIIHIKGNRNAVLGSPGVSVVGTRSATLPGKEIARRISAFLANNNFIIVSGLALGIDASAHTGALESKGITVAVLAHGLHKPTPKKNKELGLKILDLGGAWVSEHPVGIDPRREHFVPRNRIQIGLSIASIIVEAEKNSGSISQANFCLANHRSLFAVIPDESSNRLNLLSEGTKLLVEDSKAIPLRSKNDYPMLLEILHTTRL